MDREGLKRLVLKYGTFTTAAGVRGNPRGPLRIGFVSGVTWLKLGQLEIGRGPGARLFFNRAYHPRFGYRARRGWRWEARPDDLEIEGRPPWENDDSFRAALRANQS